MSVCVFFVTFACMKQAMIFAAGMGTRLKPITDIMPKALVKVAGVPLLQRVILKLKADGFSRIVVNVHHFSQQILDFLSANDDFGVDIRISDESDMLLETGGGLKKASALFDTDSPVLIHNVDILSNVDLRQLYNKAVADDTDVLMLVSPRDTKRYLLFNDDMRLTGWTNIATGEVKSPYPGLQPGQCHRYAFSGIHLLSPRLFDDMRHWPEKFGIIDFYLDVCAKANVKGYVKDDLRLLDVGKLDTLHDAEAFVSDC